VARFFFAVWPDGACARALEALAPSVAEVVGGKAVPVEKIHMTLAFLGAIDDDARRRANAAAQPLRAPPFDITLDRIGAFRRARVAWAGASQAPAPLLDLQARLEASLRASGFDLEARAFAPHVTLARKAARPLPPAAIAPIPWRVDAFTLVRSDGGSGRYAVEECWKLGI
jgi:2'-5' RNA ligase